MPITIKPPVDFRINDTKLYLVSIVYDKHVSWEFCMRVLMTVFYHTKDDALMITEMILTNGEGLCGGYMFEIAESKAMMVETLAKDEGFSLSCLVEEVSLS